MNKNKLDLKVGHCTCMTKTPEPKHHTHGCPVRAGIKFSVLFYLSEGFDAYIPAPDKVQQIISVDDELEENESVEIEFKRFDMTDKEIDNLPDAE